MSTEPTPTLSSDDKLWAIVSHLALFLGFGYILVPLIIFLVKKSDSPAVAAHAREALNFHISLVIYGIISFILLTVFIGILGFIYIGIVFFVFPIIAAVKASQGNFFRYPLTIRLVK